MRRDGEYSIYLDKSFEEISLFEMMRWIAILLFILGCTREVYKPPPPDFPEELIQRLEKGFEFKWNVKREKGDIQSTFKASGVYKGSGDFQMNGTIKIGNIEEPISEIDPYEEIRNLSGKRDFLLISRNGDEYTYSFTANLSLFSPGGKEGVGRVIINQEGIEKISAKTEGIEWEMKIEPRKRVHRKSLETGKNIDTPTLKKRLEYYGERMVEVKDNRIYFEEVIPIKRDGLLFKRGDYSTYRVAPAPEGELILSPDSIECYTKQGLIRTRIEDVSIRLDEHGESWITVVFDTPIEESLTGVQIDGELFGIGHPSGETLRFTLKNDRLAKEIYAVLKSHADLINE